MIEEMRRRIGVHTSIAGGLHRSLERANALGCNTMQIFSHNPRADVIGAEYVILHPGSASDDDEHISRKRTIVALNEVSPRGRWKSCLIIENTAGERGDISYTRDTKETRL